MHEKEKQIIQYLLKQMPSGLTKTELLKAIYLADYESRRYRGNPVSSFEYVYYHYGPYDQKYSNIIDELVNNEILLEKKFFSASKRHGSAFYLNAQKIQKELLTLEDLYILKYIIREIKLLGNAPLEVLLEQVYETEPMQNVERNQKLNMEQVNNQLRNNNFSLEDIALSEYEYEQGDYIYLEDLERELQNYSVQIDGRKN